MLASKQSFKVDEALKKKIDFLQNRQIKVTK